MAEQEFKAKQELLLYGPIWDEMVAELVEEINEYEDEAALTVRMHTPGGDVFGGYSVLSRLSDRTGTTDIFVDGEAYSMGAFMCLYANRVTASEMAEFMFHKAALPTWYNPTESEQARLKQMNANFKAKMKARFNDTPLAQEIIAKVFEPDVRNDVFVTAKEAKSIGLVAEIKTLDLGTKARVNAISKIYASYDRKQIKENASKDGKDTQPAGDKEAPNGSGIINNSKVMNLEQLKAEHPALYAQVFEAGKTTGIEAERDRVGSFMAFAAASPELVKAGIESGKAMTETQRSEFAMAAFKMTANAEQATEDLKPIETSDADKGEDRSVKIKAELDAAILSKTSLTLKA